MADVNEDRVRHCSGVREGFHLRGAVCTWHGIRQKRTTVPLPTAAFFVVPQPRNGAAFGYTGHIVKLVDAWKSSLSD